MATSLAALLEQIVTLGNNVLMENRNNLAKPTRESLGGDAIVKHWSKR